MLKMKTLEELTRDLENIEANRDAKLFHEVIGDIITKMGFVKIYDFYGIGVKTWNYDKEGKVKLNESIINNFTFEQLQDLNYFIEISKFPVDSFTKNQEFKKEKTLLNLITIYNNFIHLRDGIYNYKFITSNSKLNTNRHIADFYDIKRNHPYKDGKEILNMVLDFGGILKRGDMYFFNTKNIIELFSPESQIIYVHLIEKD